MVLKNLFRCSQLLLCYPAPPETSNGKWDNGIRLANEAFTILDLFNSVLDVIFATRLINQGLRAEGITLFIGIAVALVASHLGNTLVNSSQGLEWKPFCQSKYPPQRADKLKIMFAMVFTELTVFLFEDMTTVFIYYHEIQEDTDVWDIANLYLTAMSAVVAFVLLMMTIIYSIYCPMASNSCIGSIGYLLLNIVRTVFFLFTFGCVLVVVILSLLFVASFLIGNQRAQFWKGSLGFSFFWLFCIWLVGLFFLSNLIRGRLGLLRKFTKEDEEEDPTPEIMNSKKETKSETKYVEKIRREESSNDAWSV